MSTARFIAGDWGTTRLRLHLCDGNGALLERAEGPGAATVGADFARVFDTLTGDWMRADSGLQALLCGMVGSTIGWVQAPYVECPARAHQIAAGCVTLRGGRVRIVPGLSCRNSLGAPDVLRGEETQILGLLERQPALRAGRHVLWMPGTHVKWVVIDDGAVTGFHTAPTGELYALIAEHSVLAAGAVRSPTIAVGEPFRRGLRASSGPRGDLLSRLFQVRSRQLSGEIPAGDAAAFLSGLLIGHDVSGAAALLDASATTTLQLVGTPELTTLYRVALESNGIASVATDGDAALRAGLLVVHTLLSASPRPDAAR